MSDTSPSSTAQKTGFHFRDLQKMFGGSQSSGRQFGILGALVVIIVLFQFLTKGKTLDPNNLINIVNGNEEIKVAEDSRRSLNIKAPSVLSIVGKLSGGNQQKVVLSKWLFTDPDVLILDEPTRGIDVGAKYEIYTIVNKLVADGKAVVVISSELPELLGICDRIYTLSAGRITGQLPVREATQESLMELMTKERESV